MSCSVLLPLSPQLDSAQLCSSPVACSLVILSLLCVFLVSCSKFQVPRIPSISVFLAYLHSKSYLVSFSSKAVFPSTSLRLAPNLPVTQYELRQFHTGKLLIMFSFRDRLLSWCVVHVVEVFRLGALGVLAGTSVFLRSRDTGSIFT